MSGGIRFGHDSNSRAREHPVSPRRAPPYVIGGSLSRAPNGDLATIQTTNMTYPAPMVVRQIWASVSQRRHLAAFDGREHEGALVIYWSDPITLACGHCRRNLGEYRAYKAGREYGVIQADSHHDRLTAKRSTPTADPRHWLTGNYGSYAAETIGHFACPRCQHHYERNLYRLGRRLWRHRAHTIDLLP
jgi:hypothetical protein